tara:strand:+ start:681 stop:860 length:180 start_codon:yes stop_codon:yes gene_type:complete
LNSKISFKWLTNLGVMIKKQRKTGVKGQKPSTNFQLSYFYSLETIDIQEFCQVCTIEWE